MRLTARSTSAGRFYQDHNEDKLILTLIYRCEYRSMESIAKEYEVSLRYHCGQHPLGGAHAAERRSAANSVTCVYKTN